MAGTIGNLNGFGELTKLVDEIPTIEAVAQLPLAERVETGLGDAGAHVNFISDCSSTTFHLTHWARDRTRGDKLPVELVVHKLTAANAELYGFIVPGTLEVGKRADINVDFEELDVICRRRENRFVTRAPMEPDTVQNGGFSGRCRVYE